MKNQFERAEAQVSIRTEVERNAKRLKLGALYTSIESLETEFRNGGYCPDLLDEEILTVRQKIRLILAGSRQIGLDQNNVGGELKRHSPESNSSVFILCIDEISRPQTVVLRKRLACRIP